MNPTGTCHRRSKIKYEDRGESETRALEEEPLALITGGRLFGHGARKEPHESSPHAELVGDLRVT